MGWEGRPRSPSDKLAVINALEVQSRRMEVDPW
jgi:hypothetical protein